MRRFYISAERLTRSRPFIDGSEAHHLRAVLRSQPGDIIDVLDGEGNQYRARVVSINRERVYVALETPILQEKESTIEMVLAQGLLKDKKMDGLVRQLTELGVDRWIPFVAGRSVPVPDERRLSARYERWQKISLEAVKQCGRSRAMIIEPVALFENALKQAQGCDLKLIFWEKNAGLENLQPPRMVKPVKVFIMIGPEGGFDPKEITRAQQKGFLTVGMGPRILRAETATLAAAVMAQFVFGDMGQNFLDNG